MQACKIYTYADPYKITEASFWQEISGCPHLCSSRALVNGLTGLYGKDFTPVICTIEDVLQILYPEWLQEIELQIEQRVLISRCIDQSEMGPELKKAFRFNKNDLLKAVRFLRELGLDAAQFETGCLTPEQAHFVDLYSRLVEQHREVFSLRQQRHLEAVEEEKEPGEELLLSHFLQALQSCMETRIADQEQQIRYMQGLFARLDAKGEGKRASAAEKRFLQEQIAWKEWLEGQLLQWENSLKSGAGIVKKVVFHGLHLFTPMRVKLIQQLEKWGLEIVFLHNYEPTFPNIYQTWDRVYSWADTVAQRDINNPAYRRGEYLLQHFPPLGEAMAGLLDGAFKAYDLSALECYEFDNNTSLANYAGDVHEGAKQSRLELREGVAGDGRPAELFYAADYRPVNGILKMYYPELYGDRHFLAYPVGQFVMALYNMWDESIERLKINPQLLAECFNTNLFIKEPGKLQEIWQQARLFFQDVSDINDYLQRLELLADNRERLDEEKDLQDLKMFSFYSLSGADIVLLKENISRLNALACGLFAEKQGDRIDFKMHFRRLLDLIKEEAHNNRELDEEEEYLISSLMERFDNLDKLSISGSMEDLKESVHFYLKQKETEVEEGGWLVRNFEQIEGDILLSKIQGDKRYHFTGLTEKNMQVQINDRLPWPLTDDFFTEGYDSKNKGLSIVFDSMKEYKNFLRYAFFYGVYYVQQPFRLSFVKHEDEQEAQPWFLLNLLGIEWEQQVEPETDLAAEAMPVINNVAPEPIRAEGLEKIDCQAFTFCPYRYVLDRGLGNGSAYHNEYLCSQYFMVIFYEMVWEILSGKRYDHDVLIDTMAKVEARLKPFFPFWKPQFDFADKRSKVKGWVTAGVSKNMFPTLSDGDRSYLDIKKHFIYARITGENGENQLLGLHRLRPDSPNTQYRNKAERGINDLLNNSEAITFNLGEWCEVCKEREVCLESYKKDS